MSSQIMQKCRLRDVLVVCPLTSSGLCFISEKIWKYKFDRFGARKLSVFRVSILLRIERLVQKKWGLPRKFCRIFLNLHVSKLVYKKKI